MPFDIDRKLSYLDRLQAKFPETIEAALSNLAAIPEIKADKKLNFTGISSNLKVLNDYNQQLKNGGQGISAASAEKAWTALKAQLAPMFPSVLNYTNAIPANAPEKSTKTNYVMFLNGINDAIKLEAAHEKAYDTKKLQNAVFTPPAASTAYNPTESRPYVTTLIQANVVEQLEALAASPVLANDNSLAFNQYKNALTAVTDYVKAINDPRALVNPNLRPQVEKAWRYLCERTPAVLNTVNTKLSSMSATANGYNELQKFGTVLSLCDDSIKRSQHIEKLRQYKAETAKLEKTFSSVEREIAIFNQPDDSSSVSVSVDGDISESESILDAKRAELNSYKWKMSESGLVFEEEMNALDQNIENIKKTLPAELYRRFENADSFDKLKEIDEEYRNKFNSARNAQFNETMNFGKEVFGALGNTGNGNARDALARAIRVYSANTLTGRDGDVEKFNAGIEKLLDDFSAKHNGYPSDEIKFKLYDVCDKNVKKYNDLTKDLNRNMQILTNLDNAWDLKVLEGKKALQANANKPLYEKMQERTLHSLEDEANRAMREKLGAYYQRLNKMHKIGANTTEYRRFRSALEEATKTGNTEKLLAEAFSYTYQKEKNGAPTSANGIARLNLAKEIVSLLTPVRENEKRHVIIDDVKPAEEAPIQEGEDLIDLSEINFDDEIDAQNEAAQNEAAQPENAGPQFVNRAPFEKPNYLLSGVRSLDTFHEDLPEFLKDKLQRDLGYSNELAESLTNRMMYILDKNLTGTDRDADNIRNDFISEFSVMQEGERFPLASFPAETNAYLGALVFHANWYRDAIVNDPFMMRVDSDPDVIEDEDYEPSPEEVIKAKQNGRIYNKLCAMPGNRDQTFNQKVIDIITDRHTPNEVRNLLVATSVQTLTALRNEHQHGKDINLLLQNAVSKNAVSADDKLTSIRLKNAIKDAHQPVAHNNNNNSVGLKLD